MSHQHRSGACGTGRFHGAVCPNAGVGESPYGKSLYGESVEASWTVRAAVECQLEIIGEAAGRTLLPQ
ncbi:MAG: hypothetical protein OXH63_15395 [Gemmatimonadetes bacterium]|nr:hypothetical protein [Gemmatimonadota bacterium]